MALKTCTHDLTLTYPVDLLSYIGTPGYLGTKVGNQVPVTIKQ